MPTEPEILFPAPEVQPAPQPTHEVVSWEQALKIKQGMPQAEALPVQEGIPILPPVQEERAGTTEQLAVGTVEQQPTLEPAVQTRAEDVKNGELQPGENPLTPNLPQDHLVNLDEPPLSQDHVITRAVHEPTDANLVALSNAVAGKDLTSTELPEDFAQAA